MCVYIYIVYKKIFNKKCTNVLKTFYGNWHNIPMAYLMKVFLKVNPI